MLTCRPARPRHSALPVFW